MKFSPLISAFLCLALALATVSRAVNAAMMPFAMSAASASAAAEKAPTPPCHGEMDAQTDVESCSFCGECCISSPPVAGFDATRWLNVAPHERPAQATCAKAVFLTPGIDRPPSP